MPLAFTKDAEPAVIEPHKIGERIMRRLIPNFRRGGSWHRILRDQRVTIQAPLSHKDQQQRNSFHQVFPFQLDHFIRADS
jgi:hypothetical protein